MPEFSAVICDFDGLLVDSEPVQFAAWERYLESINAALTPELRSEMYGRRLIDASRAVVEHFDLAITPDQVANGRDAVFLTMVPGAVCAKPGAKQLLADLIDRGMKLALATSGHRRYVDLALESAAIERLFDVEVTGEMVERGKPDPETFLTAARLLGVEPSSCLVLEDSPHGVRAANAAGMICFAVPDSPEHRPLLAGADLILDSLCDVTQALDEMTC